MKIVRTIPLACLVLVLSACGSGSITGPDAAARPAPPANVQDGVGTMGSGG
jgi:hypothetical protein